MNFGAASLDVKGPFQKQKHATNNRMYSNPDYPDNPGHPDRSSKIKTNAFKSLRYV